MPMNPTVARHLNEAMAELRTQREEIDAAIKQLTITIESLGGVVDATPAARAAGAPDASAPSRVGTPVVTIAPPMKDAILLYMDQAGRDVTTAEVAEALASAYGWSKASVRSLMSKLSKDGVIGSPRRGVYNTDPASTPDEAPEMSETPDLWPGVSDDDAPTMALGGDGDQQAQPSGHRSSFSERDGDRDDRASVVE